MYTFDKIQKGKISKVEGEPDKNGNKTRARVVPCMAEENVTGPLVIPWHLRGTMGNLKPETEVVFVVFEDQSGMILARADGEWDGRMPGQVIVGAGLQVKGVLEATDLKTAQVPSYNAHVHEGVTAGAEDTKKPK